MNHRWSGELDEAKRAAKKPRCKIVGEDGNVFNLVGVVRRCLVMHGKSAESKEMASRVMKASSYDEALAIMSEYADLE